ncbi:hypothetical protein NECAME_09461, partial [Necator americanus]
SAVEFVVVVEHSTGPHDGARTAPTRIHITHVLAPGDRRKLSGFRVWGDGLREYAYRLFPIFYIGQKVLDFPGKQCIAVHAVVYQTIPHALKNLDMEMDDLVIEESLKIQTTNMICSKNEELEVKDVLSSLRSLRRGLCDVTNSPRFSHAESPKSRKSLFAKPQMPRAASMYNSRKRCLHTSSLEHKRYRIDSVAEEHENAPTCSASTTGTTSRRTSLMLRVQSSSVLEVGHHHLPQFLEVKYHLETLTTNDSQAFRRIDARTLSQLMKSMSSEEFAQKYVLIDCRYPYEFNGGHIKGAINIYDTAKCEEVFFPSITSAQKEGIQRRIPIFYCEYSQKRGPSIPQSRLALRQLSEGAYHSPSNQGSGSMRPSSRRPLFTAPPKTPESQQPASADCVCECRYSSDTSHFFSS